MNVNRRVALLTMMVVAAGPLVLAGCTGNPAGRATAPVKPPPAPPTVAVSPAADAKNVPVSAEISLTARGGTVTELKVTDGKGVPVKGAMRPDYTSWVPSKPLGYQRAYTVAVTIAGDSGQTTTQTATFTTMAQPTKLTGTTLYFADDMTYGVAMPVTVNFDQAVPAEARADVQRRLFVHTDPRQPGTWHWLDSGTEVFYRAPDFWRPGTKISVRTALEGLPMGDGHYGDADHTATSVIGNRVSLDISNRTKQMSVYVNGKLARKIPVSMGKARTPTSSGKMVIMEKFDYKTFDTRNDPEGGYVVTVANAQRLTWGGEFIHAAPWSVGDQGHRNVSHGCTNVSNEAAAWLMDVTHVGDLVTIKGTEVKLDLGNGWTAWNMSWEEFVKGSALPVPAELTPASKSSSLTDSSPAPLPSPTD
jgi:lipoprotein-anchoring transpeptidase ErfK/SrfK